MREIIACVLAIASCNPASAPAPTVGSSGGSNVAQAGSAGSSAGSSVAQAGSSEAGPYAAALAQDCNLLTADAAAEILGVKASTLKPHVERQGDQMIMCGFEGHNTAIGYQMVHWINAQAARDHYLEFVGDAKKLDSYVAVQGVGDAAAWAKLEDTPALGSYKGNLLMFVMLPKDQAKATAVAKKIWSAL